MITLENVGISFDGSTLLDGISFHIAEGEKVSILGPGASGKSTIVKMILGLVPPDSGSISLLGNDMIQSSEPEKQRILRDLGMSFQQGALFDYMNVEENLFFAMENMTDLTKEQMNERVDQLLGIVKLPHTKKMYPYELSGGMQRRVGVARAITTNPKIAIFDEPTSGLDPVTSTIILNMIDELIPRESGKTSVVVTSSVEIAIRFAERIILVNDGEIVADGSWKELIVKSTEWIENFLGVRLIGIDVNYARELGLPEEYIKRHWPA